MWTKSTLKKIQEKNFFLGRERFRTTKFRVREYKEREALRERKKFKERMKFSEKKESERFRE